MKRQAKKPEFGISRNGEHVERGFDSREEAESRVAELKQDDQAAVKAGWTTTDQAAANRYWVEEIKHRSW